MSRLRSRSAGSPNSRSHNLAQKRDRGATRWIFFAACFAVGAVGLAPMGAAQANNPFLETPLVCSVLEVSAVPEENGKPSSSVADIVAGAGGDAFRHKQAAAYFSNSLKKAFFQNKLSIDAFIFKSHNRNQNELRTSWNSTIPADNPQSQKKQEIEIVKSEYFIQQNKDIRMYRDLKFDNERKKFEYYQTTGAGVAPPTFSMGMGRRDAIVFDSIGDGDIYNEVDIWSCGSPYGEWTMQNRGGIRSAGAHGEMYGTFFMPLPQDGISTSEPFTYEGETVFSVPGVPVFWRGRSHATAIAHVGRPTRGPLKLGIELIEARDVTDVLIIDGKLQTPPPPQIRGREPIQWTLIQFGSSNRCPPFESPEECEPHVWDAPQRAEGASHYRDLISSRRSFTNRHRVHAATLERCDEGTETTAACIGAEDAIRRNNIWLDQFAQDCGRILDFFAADPARWQSFIDCLPDAGMPTMARMLEEYCHPTDTCDLIHNDVLRGAAGSLGETHRRLTDCAKPLYPTPSDLAIFTAPSWFFRW